MTENELHDYYLKALYYAWGRQDGGAEVNAVEFANCYRHSAELGHVVDVLDAFKMFQSGKRLFSRV